MPGFSRDMLDEAMYVHKSLVRIRCMRNTMFILPREIVPAAFAATKKWSWLNAERFRKNSGPGDDETEAVSGKIVALLAGGGKTTAEIKRSIGPVTNLPAVLTLLCDRGVLVRGEIPNWRSNQYRYHLFSEYLPGLQLDSIDEPAAILQLARSYYAAFGPATADDFSWWSGLGKTKVRAALDELPVAHLEISGLAGDFLVLQGDLRTLSRKEENATTTVNLLPGLDPYVMGYKVRDRYLSRDSYGLTFDRSGNSANTIVVDGRLSGVWDTDGEDGPQVKLYLFEEVDQGSRKKIVAEASRLGQFIYGRPVTVRECRSMVPLTDRPPGGFLSPLKGQ
jgi:hypothetical protein